MKTSLRKYTCDECGAVTHVPDDDEDGPDGWRTVHVHVSSPNDRSAKNFSAGPGPSSGISVEKDVCSLRCAAVSVTEAAKKLAGAAR